MTNTLDWKPSTPLPKSRKIDLAPSGADLGAYQYSSGSKEMFRAIQQLSATIIRYENMPRAVLRFVKDSIARSAPALENVAILTPGNYHAQFEEPHMLSTGMLPSRLVDFCYRVNHETDVDHYRQPPLGNLDYARVFLRIVRQLDQRGHTDEALDFVFDQLDEMMLAHEFERVDNILPEIATSDFSIDLLIGFLTVTLPAKKHLGKRAEFFARVQSEFEKRGEETVSLLVGLD